MTVAGSPLRHLHAGDAIVRPGRVLDDPQRHLPERYAVLGVQDSQRAAGLGDVGYDVLGGPRPHPTDAKDRGVHRVQAAADQRLERDDDVGEGEDGVARAVGIGAVAARPLDGIRRLSEEALTGPASTLREPHGTSGWTCAATIAPARPASVPSLTARSAPEG